MYMNPGAEASLTGRMAKAVAGMNRAAHCNPFVRADVQVEKYPAGLLIPVAVQVDYDFPCFRSNH
jgi:hypothetical protein